MELRQAAAAQRAGQQKVPHYRLHGRLCVTQITAAGPGVRPFALSLGKQLRGEKERIF